jgi:hypothetical protein
LNGLDEKITKSTLHFSSSQLFIVSKQNNTLLSSSFRIQQHIPLRRRQYFLKIVVRN